MNFVLTLFSEAVYPSVHLVLWFLLV